MCGDWAPLGPEQRNNNNREHETCDLGVVELGPTRYVIKPHVVAWMKVCEWRLFCVVCD